MPSLRGKILTTYAFSKVVLLVFAIVVFADLYYLQTHIVAGEAVTAFREVSQEIRREEKNLFLYNDPASLDQLIVRFKEAEAALKEGEQAFAEIASPAELSRMSELLLQYHAQLREYPALPVRVRAEKQKIIRASGHELSALAENFSRRERAVVAQAVHVAGRTLLVVFVTVLLLGIGSAFFLVRQVVRPLRELESQLDQLADGHDQQLTLPSKDKEIQSFVHHFNTMLERLRVQQNQLRHREKAAALGVLVSGVAHELNNPLSNISTSVQLLVEEGDSVEPELRDEWMAQIDGEAERARRIVRRLLDSVRQPKLNWQAHSVAELIQVSLALVNRQLPRGVAVCVGYAPERALWADRDRLHQVFINLLKNAADAGATHIVVSAVESTWKDSMPKNTDHLVGEVEPVSKAENVLYIQMDDNGPGIAPENLLQIFNPFFTTHSAGDGTGLGLYLVEEIISEHNGCIAVENRPQGGTRFSIWLPLNDAQETP
ncbi:MAG: HAMP domain-containing histidine kinase [Sulfuriferula multivorans]|uniref:histidine kinase n=1 Tax=Sulfuriferula multivorans TaxID=1559896 RepID=A0A7C9JVP5_9PROT|nr:HAMP domain-containing histidine kinase [Sulfuriferula multivorans]